MTKEGLQPPTGYDFTEHEKLYNRISDGRFMEILHDDQTIVHDISASSNNYGEFLFITVSRPTTDKRDCLTFYGLGYHERRERWITETWSWYDAHQTEERMEMQVEREQTEALIQARREEIVEDMQHFPEAQSRSGALYEFLADLTDEDGAASELDDLLDNGFLDEE
jgi:hypothetical protein